MWPGPYGEWGSRKYLLASLDQSLQRMGLDYVDIFYSHRFDPDTPLEETLGALDTAVRQGKALYAGISSYSAERTEEAVADPARPRHAAAHPPAVLLAAEPLDRARPARRPRPRGRRLHRLLAARAGHAHRPLPRRHPRGLARRAATARCRSDCSATRTSRASARSTRSRSARGQTLAQMALAWMLRDPRVTSALIGASSVAQLEDNVGALAQPGLRRRRAGRDRPARGRRRDQHLGAVELGLTCAPGARACTPADSVPLGAAVGAAQPLKRQRTNARVGRRATLVTLTGRRRTLTMKACPPPPPASSQHSPPSP